MAPPLRLIFDSLKIFCFLGGPYIAPVFVPLINPLCWSICLLSFFLPLRFTYSNFLNTKPGETTVDTGRTMQFSFIIYYIFTVASLFFVMSDVCKKADQISAASQGLL